MTITTIQDEIGERLHQWAADGQSRGSLYTYRSALRDLPGFLAARGICELRSVTVDDATAFLAAAAAKLPAHRLRILRPALRVVVGWPPAAAAGGPRRHFHAPFLINPYVRVYGSVLSRAGKSDRTLPGEIAEVERFVAWYAHEYGNSLATANLDLVTPNDVRRYLYDDDDGGKASTRRRRFSVLRQFFGVLQHHGYVRRHPMRSMSPPRVPQSGERDMTEHEIEDVTVAASAEPNWQRNMAILSVMLTTGCRVSAVVGMRLGEVDLLGGSAVLTEKGPRQIEVPLTAGTVQALTNYLSVRRPRDRQSQALFLNDRGTPLTAPTFRTWLRRWAHQAGLRNVYPHRLRHTVATSVFTSGGSMEEVRQLLGHRRLATTAQYVHATRDVAHVRNIDPLAPVSDGEDHRAPRPWSQRQA